MYSRFLSLLLFFISPFVLAKELRVCADPDNLPYSRRDESGFENRIASLVAAELGATLAYTWHPQQRGFVRKTIGAGTCDVWMGVPADFERVLTTKPYYRSSYVFVFNRIALRSFDDPQLKSLRIGVQLPGNDLAATPPGHALALRGAIDNVSGFAVMGESHAAERIVEAIAAGKLDAGVVWGPQAGFFAAKKALNISPAEAPAELKGIPFEFSIAMGVKHGRRALRDELDGVIDRRRADLEAILVEYHVPRVP